MARNEHRDEDANGDGLTKVGNLVGFGVSLICSRECAHVKWRGVVGMLGYVCNVSLKYILPLPVRVGRRGW